MATKKVRVAINGFGRIGRTIARQILLSKNESKFQIVHINDVAPLATCAYLFRFDSIYGPFEGSIREGLERLLICGQSIPFTQFADISVLNLSNVDVVLECTGAVKSRKIAERGIVAKAHNVLVSGPAKGMDATIVLGANEDLLCSARIISNASCTTNAIAPLLKILDGDFRIERGHISTIHCYTNSQPLTDAPRESLTRSRGGALSMVPTTTSATRLVEEILPQLKDRVTGSAIRVPTASVSAIDAVLQFEKPISSSLNDWLKKATSGSRTIATTSYPIVSCDIKGRSESLVVALPETRQIGEKQVRIFGWYDNEWGFSSRMLDVAELMAKRDKKQRRK